MIPGADQIRIPMPDGTYRDYPLTHLMGIKGNQLMSRQGFGMPPIKIIDQQGPIQDGSTLVTSRINSRVIQVLIHKQVLNVLDLDRFKYELVDMIRPNRVFSDRGGVPTPLVYRKWLPGGALIRGTDGVLTNGSEYFTSQTAKFVHHGLRVGSLVYIDPAGGYVPMVVQSVLNDSTIEWFNWGVATVTDIPWYYRSEPCFRDLYCTLEYGPAFNSTQQDENGYTEAMRFYAADPFWYGGEQSVVWDIINEYNHLKFDYGDPGVVTPSAQFGTTWEFANTYVTEDIDLAYWGHYGAVPIITIDGPGRDYIFSNTDLNSQITFNYTVADGEQIVIDTLSLTAVSSINGDVFSSLSGDITGFLLSPDVANDRVNTIRVEFSAARANSAVTMSWQNRYLIA